MTTESLIEVIPHSRPTLGDGEVQAMAEVVQSGFLAQGARVARFEEALARGLAVAGGVATSSGTAALHLALLTLRVGEGDEVLLPTYACSALLQAVRAVRASPRFVDCDPVTFNMDPEAARRACSKKAKALIVVHTFGLPAELDALKGLGVPVVEAAAQALGAFYRGKPVGSVGDVAVFSFYATKVITTGEGGMLFSSDERILAAARDLREYDNKWDDRPRFNYKMTEVQAALGLAQLGQLPDFLCRRRAIALQYGAGLKGLPLQLPPPTPHRAWYRYVVKAPVPVARYLERLQACGVEARRPVFRPLHWALGMAGFPGAEEAWNRAISFPLYPSLRNGEVQQVLSAARESFR